MECGGGFECDGGILGTLRFSEWPSSSSSLSWSSTIRRFSFSTESRSSIKEDGARDDPQDIPDIEPSSTFVEVGLDHEAMSRLSILCCSSSVVTGDRTAILIFLSFGYCFLDCGSRDEMESVALNFVLFFFSDSILECQSTQQLEFLKKVRCQELKWREEAVCI